MVDPYNVYDPTRRQAPSACLLNLSGTLRGAWVCLGSKVWGGLETWVGALLAMLHSAMSPDSRDGQRKDGGVGLPCTVDEEAKVASSDKIDSEGAACDRGLGCER